MCHVLLGLAECLLVFAWFYLHSLGHAWFLLGLNRIFIDLARIRLVLLGVSLV